jgi:hypothetical protein
MKNAKPTVKAELSASDNGQYNLSSTFPGTENPRLLRVIYALLRGPCTRAEIDAAAGASNGPEVIAQLRRRGLTIYCELVPAVDRDGKTVRFGVYRLTEEDRQKLRIWLAARANKQRTHGS